MYRNRKIPAWLSLSKPTPFFFPGAKQEGPSTSSGKSAVGMAARLLLKLLAALLIATPVQASRIKDLGAFQGVRTNQLTGYGIVVGLAGTGDDSLEYATQGMKGVASRFGLSLPPGINPALKNAAAVMITAELPPFAKLNSDLCADQLVWYSRLFVPKLT